MLDNSLLNTLRNITINYMDNNITLETVDKQGPESNSVADLDSVSDSATNPVPLPTPPSVNLDTLVIRDENTALNVMISFLQMAQKRGAFNLQESSKVWECVQVFMKKH